MSLLILSTLVITFFISDTVNQDTQKLTWLEQIEVHLLEWSSQTAPIMIRPDDLLAIRKDLEILTTGGEITKNQSTQLSNLTLSPINDEESLSQIMAAIVILDEIDQSLDLDANGTQSNFELSARVARILEIIQTIKFDIQLHRADSLGMARGMYAALFISSTCFLLIGLWFTEELIAKPLEELVQVSYRIAKGDLDTPVILSESHDFEELGTSLNAMRLELRESREQLAGWASELENKVTSRTQQLAALSQVVTAASRTLELDVLLHTGLEQALQVMGIKTGGIWLVDEDQDVLRLAVSNGMSEYLRDVLGTFPNGEGVTGNVARSGETIVMEDISQSPQQIRLIASHEGLRSLVAIPIKVHSRVVGVLDVMTHEPRAFTSDEIALLNSIGHQIGLGVENSRLINEIRQQTERVASLQEREWIGAELHDGLLQVISYLYLKIDQLETQAALQGHLEFSQQLTHQREILEQVSADIRHFISDLRETVPPSMSLPHTLRKMISELQNEVGIEIDLAIYGPARRIRADHVAHLVRIAREAVLNAHRHGNATKAFVQCKFDENNGELLIKDNGIGFIPENIADMERNHFGLSIMRARAARVGGSLLIQSNPGSGTEVKVAWPLVTE